MGRLLGALLLTLGGLWAGMGAAGELSSRARALASWENALELWEDELAFRLPDLPGLLEDLSRRAAEPAGDALAAVRTGLSQLGERSFGEIWEEALVGTPGGLNQGDRELLGRLGGILGRCGGSEQRSAVERTRRALEERSRLLREERRGRERTRCVLGLALGAFAALLLL